MSSLSTKDRASLCSFTFSDGRRCRTPLNRNHPHFCFYHAQKEARAHAAETLGKDLAYFFSGDYLSACDLSTALARLIPAVLRGDVKPRAARTVAYLAQTLMQAIHISQHEYCEAFSSDTWRRSIRNSVRGNHDYRFPPAPKPEQQMEQAPHVVAGLQTGRAQVPQPAPAAQPVPQPAPSPHTSLPPTSAEFVQKVLAGQNSSRPPRASRRSGQESGPATINSSAANHASPSATTPPSPGPASVHSPASGSQPTPSSPLPTGRPATSPNQSSTRAQHSPQQPSETQPPDAAAPSAARQEARPAVGPQTGPSGLPVLASLPTRKPGAPPGSRYS